MATGNKIKMRKYKALINQKLMENRYGEKFKMATETKTKHVNTNFGNLKNHGNSLKSDRSKMNMATGNKECM